MEKNSWIKQYAIILFIILAIYFLFHCSPVENDFEIAVEFVLEREGGLSDDPDDPGGLTKYGISQRAYPQLDIENLTVYDAKEIYYQDYWLKSGCDKLVPPLDLIVFDTSVHCGVSRARGFLEESSDWRDYLLRRIVFYSKLEIAKYFMRGWTNRVVSLYENIEKEER